MAQKVLGRGLGALISDAGPVTRPATPAPIQRTNDSISEIALSQIEANPNQPRTKFDEESLMELAESIRNLGVIQPITLRELSSGKYQIVSGERRYRATQLVGLDTIPAYVRKVNDDQLLMLGLVENVQREDLDPIEIAISYQRLLDECRLTQELLSEKVGKKRSSVANYLRLLKLPPEIQVGIINKDISFGHARALIAIEEEDLKLSIYREIIEKDLSVRQVEELIRNARNKNTETPAQAEEKAKSAKETVVLPESYQKLQLQLSSKFNTSVSFKRSDKGKGEITFAFKTDEELERLIVLLDQVNNS